MKDSERDKPLHEAGTAYVAEAAKTEEMIRVYFDVPQSLWKRFMRWAEGQHLSSTEALLSLIQRQVAPPVEAPTGFYADLTRRYLRGELELTPGFPDFCLDEKTVAAISYDLGTDDPVEWVERARNRW